MRTEPTIRCVWTGQSLVPDGNFAEAQLRDRLGDGQVVQVDIDPERSGQSHRHQFAFIKTAWENIPEDLKALPYAVSPETFRKHALIATGYCESSMVAVGCPKRAERIASVIDATARRLSGYAITEVKGPVVYCHTPLSQSVKAMGGDDFKKSKQAILEWMADLIGVSADDLATMGKKEAA